MKRTRSRQLLYIIIIVAIFLFLFEGALSIFIYQKTGPEKLASLETLKTIKASLFTKPISFNVTNHNLVRPDSTEEVNHAIALETFRSNRFIYEPWVEFRNMDFSGKFMNMSDGLRKSSPAEYIVPSSPDTIDIYFLGGSTMFGFNVLDYETVPSQFLQLYKQKFPGRKSIRVFNYGTPTYYSYQELILLSDLIFKNHRPDIVVFLDGVNDFWFGKASYYHQSNFSYVFRQFFNQGLRTKGEFQFVDTADAMSKDPADIPAEQYYNSLIENYERNMKNASRLAATVGARSYFFCQPSPFYNYPNQQKDPICFKDTNTRFNFIYPVLQEKADSLKNFTFLGNMLEKETGYPFVDGLHYSPKFISKIADEILLKLEKDL